MKSSTTIKILACLMAFLLLNLPIAFAEQISLNDGTKFTREKSNKVLFDRGDTKFIIESDIDIHEVGDIKKTREWEYKELGDHFEILKSNKKLVQVDYNHICSEESKSEKILNNHGSIKIKGYDYDDCIFYPSQVASWDKDTLDSRKITRVDDYTFKISFKDPYDPTVVNFTGDCDSTCLVSTSAYNLTLVEGTIANDFYSNRSGYSITYADTTDSRPIGSIYSSSFVMHPTVTSTNCNASDDDSESFVAINCSNENSEQRWLFFEDYIESTSNAAGADYYVASYFNPNSYNGSFTNGTETLGVVLSNDGLTSNSPNGTLGYKAGDSHTTFVAWTWNSSLNDEFHVRTETSPWRWWAFIGWTTAIPGSQDMWQRFKIMDLNFSLNFPDSMTQPLNCFRNNTGCQNFTAGSDSDVTPGSQATTTSDLQYDANGNLVSGDGFYREYNGLNQLERVREGNAVGGTVLEEFVWHPLQNRVLIKDVFESGTLKESVYYVTDEFIRIENGSGNFSEKFVYQGTTLLAQVNTDGEKEFVHPDHLGSSSLITDVNGNVIDEAYYSPFGELLEGGDASRYSYEGMEFDEKVGDYDFHFRKYRADWGRFTQPDTLIFNFYDPQGLNRFAFERNNPVINTDPSGHIAGQEFEAIKEQFKWNPQQALDQFFDDVNKAWNGNDPSVVILREGADRVPVAEDTTIIIDYLITEGHRVNGNEWFYNDEIRLKKQRDAFWAVPSLLNDLIPNPAGSAFSSTRRGANYYGLVSGNNPFRVAYNSGSSLIGALLSSGSSGGGGRSSFTGNVIHDPFGVGDFINRWLAQNPEKRDDLEQATGGRGSRGGGGGGSSGGSSGGGGGSVVEFSDGSRYHCTNC